MTERQPSTAAKIFVDASRDQLGPMYTTIFDKMNPHDHAYLDELIATPGVTADHITNYLATFLEPTQLELLEAKLAEQPLDFATQNTAIENCLSEMDRIIDTAQIDEDPVVEPTQNIEVDTHSSIDPQLLLLIGTVYGIQARIDLEDNPEKLNMYIQNLQRDKEKYNLGPGQYSVTVFQAQ